MKKFTHKELKDAFVEWLELSALGTEEDIKYLEIRLQQTKALLEGIKKQEVERSS